MGVMNMVNIVTRAGIKPTSLAFWAGVLPLDCVGYLMSPLYPRLPVYAAPCLRGQCRLLHIHAHMYTHVYAHINSYNLHYFIFMQLLLQITNHGDI